MSHGFDEQDASTSGHVESALQKLQKRAFGGQDVAARPGSEDDEWWPRGPLLPGVQEVLDDFVSVADRQHDLKLVFLLGGAGNGKSFAAKVLGSRLGLGEVSGDGLAKRIYQVKLGEVNVEILNDATIASGKDYGSRQELALATDIERWWEQSASAPTAAFCCVNRGIIVDELQALQGLEGDGSAVSARLLSWLSSPEDGLIESLGAKPIDARPLLDGSHFHELQFHKNGRSVRLIALSVDSCSLVAPVDGGESIGGGLFGKVLNLCREEAAERPAECPIRANLQQWLFPGAIRRWEGVLYHAEIASGRLHSYRDVWGLSALSILGPKYAVHDGDSIMIDHVDRCLRRLSDAAATSGRLKALLELAEFRTNISIFKAPTPAGDDAAPHYPPTIPPHIGLTYVDPAIWGSEDSEKVENAMQGIALGELPSKTLLQDGLLDGVWFEFDALLERELVGFVGASQCSDKVRRRLISWFGGYLVRLVGLSKGRLGNDEVMSRWKECYQLTSRRVMRLPVSLDKAIRSLLFPRHRGLARDSILVPAFAARVEPLDATRYGTSPKLAETIAYSAINLQMARNGSRLVLECVLSGTSSVVGRLALDFSLLREAMACRGDRPGQTESSVLVEPRIERCRASSLKSVPGNERSLVVVCGESFLELNQ